METDVELYWLGRSAIHELKRVVVPESVVEWGIATVDEHVFWAVDDEETVYISGHRRPFAEDGQFTVIDDTVLGASRGLTVPAPLFASATPALQQVPVFESGDTVVFVAADSEIEADVCRVVPEDVAQNEFDDLRSAD